jgi:16S rRNA (uracil1498-N3)-methyltransferase
MHPERHRFYHPELDLSPEQELEGSEVHHMSKVLRMKVGEEVILLDGKGRLVRAEIKELKKDRGRFRVLDDLPSWDKPSGLHIAMAPTKNMDRMEWFLEKAVEMGLGSLSLIGTQRSERNKVRMDRLDRIAVSAMKQSLRTYLPHLESIHDYKPFITGASESERFIAHCYEGDKSTVIPVVGSTLILIGPEGDFTEEEVREAREIGFHALGLGEARLRTETAALKAVALYNRL